MSDKLIAFLIPAISIAIIFSWVPLLNRICPPCGRALERQRIQADALQARLLMESIRD